MFLWKLPIFYFFIDIQLQFHWRSNIVGWSSAQREEHAAAATEPLGTLQTDLVRSRSARIALHIGKGYTGVVWGRGKGEGARGKGEGGRGIPSLSLLMATELFVCLFVCFTPGRSVNVTWQSRKIDPTCFVLYFIFSATTSHLLTVRCSRNTHRVQRE